MIAVREFTNTADMLAHAVAVRARCFGPKVRQVQKIHTPVALIPQRPAPTVIVQPEWKCRETRFDAHVIVTMPILEMIKSGLIEITSSHRFTIHQIVETVLLAYPGVTVAQVRGGGRARKVCYPRQLSMYEVRRQRPDLSLPAIGRWFGGRDHTTVLHAVRKIEALHAKEGQ